MSRRCTDCFPVPVMCVLLLISLSFSLSLRCSRRATVAYKYHWPYFTSSPSNTMCYVGRNPINRVNEVSHCFVIDRVYTCTVLYINRTRYAHDCVKRINKRTSLCVPQAHVVRILLNAQPTIE